VNVVEDSLNILPKDPVDSVFGFGKTVLETPRSLTSISNELMDKVIITEMGNFPDFARFYMEEVMEPGHRLFMGILQRGIDNGELRETNLFETVHVLIFPMLMLCLHKHSLGACAEMATMMDPLSFIKTHVDVVLRGLLIREDAGAAAAPINGTPKKTRKSAPKSAPKIALKNAQNNN